VRVPILLNIQTENVENDLEFVLPPQFKRFWFGDTLHNGLENIQVVLRQGSEVTEALEHYVVKLHDKKS